MSGINEYKKLRRKVLKYKILQLLTFGAVRSYKRKKEKYRSELRDPKFHDCAQADISRRKVLKYKILQLLTLGIVKTFKARKEKYRAMLRAVPEPLNSLGNQGKRFDQLEKNLINKINFEVRKQALITQAYIAAAQLHPKTFGKYKNAFNGRDVVLVATGPSLDYYKPIEGAIHVGVNGAILRKDIAFDYFFIQDYNGATKYMEYINRYRPGECVKFYGLTVFKSIKIPYHFYYSPNVFKYITGTPITEFSEDITYNPLPEFHSIVFPALSFIMWANPKRLYIGGCDLTNKYADSLGDLPPSKSLLSQRSYIKAGWQNFERFTKYHYPNTEIISINPVGLKGMFKDQFDDEFIDTLFANEGGAMKPNSLKKRDGKNGREQNRYIQSFTRRIS